jgi:hypothetical protein
MGPPCFDSETFLPSNHVRAACSIVGTSLVPYILGFGRKCAVHAAQLTGRLVIEQLHASRN